MAAIGETGLDYYRDRAPRDDQRRAFEAQIEIARRVGKPLVIHVRDGAESTAGEALAETFELLRTRAEGIDGDPALLLGAARAGRPRRPSGAGTARSPATSPTRRRTSCASPRALVPDELLLVETDSPFLAPQPVRGKPNQPANVVATAEQLAEVRGVAYGELEALVEANAARVFGW